jgi:hypothetical protein
MTTTYVPFTPTPSAPFQFQATLDGATYIITTRWNLFGLRWYIEIVTTNQTLVLWTARVGSPRGVDISLTEGYFRTKIVWREPDQVFEIVEP